MKNESELITIFKKGVWGSISGRMEIPVGKIVQHPNNLINEVFNILQYRLDRSREIVVTPYYGNYGDIAGYVIAVNGSPPKGTLFVPFDAYFGPSHVMIFYYGGEIKQFRESRHPKKFRIIREFLDRYKEASEDDYETK